MKGAVRGAALVLLLIASGCRRAAPDATPEGALRLWIEKMETSEGDPRTVHEAYQLLGPHARANLKERADRASRGQGRRFEPYEMLAGGHFGLRFRPRAMTARVSGDDALVDVRGESVEERATVHCVHEPAGWRVEPDLPEIAAPPHR